MIKISWDELMDAAKMLAKMLEGKKTYGIPRGGTITACLLSYHGCELLTYPPTKKRMLGQLSPAEAEKVVIIDDIADSGETLAEWQKEGFKTAALYARGGCTPLPTFVVNTIDEDDYIMFPYEDPMKAKELERNGIYKEHS